MNISFQLAAAFACLACLGGQAAAETTQAAQRSYAILSLVGDSISIVAERPTVGSKINRNDRQVIPIGDTVFDESAIHAANDAIKNAAPASRTVLLLTPDVGLYKAQNDMFESPGSNVDNRTFLKSLLGNRNVTHLVLITKVRGDAQIWLSNAPVGTGQLDGLGYYMNHTVDIFSDSAGMSGTGLVAPFAYIKVRLIDAGTLEVMGEVVQKRAYPIGKLADAEASLVAWDVITAEQKVDYLKKLVRLTVKDTLPKLLGSNAAR